MEPLTRVEILALMVALIPALINFVGILQNNKLSKKLNNADRDNDEKYKYRIELHKRLAEFEEVVNSEKIFSNEVANKLKKISRYIKIYDPYLSEIIDVFIRRWKGYLRHCEYTSGQVSNPDYLIEFSKSIGDRADELITKPSLLKLLRSKWSWLKFRIELLNKESSTSKSSSLPHNTP